MTATPSTGLLARLNAQTLGVKLALLGAGLTAVVVGSTFLVLKARAEAAVRRVFTSELAASQRHLRSVQDQNVRLLLHTSSLVSTSPTLRAALSTYRGEALSGQPMRSDLLQTIQREVAVVFRELVRDLLVVTDDSGRVLASVPEGAFRRGESLWHIPALRAALAWSESNEPDFGLLVGDGREPPIQIGAVPIELGGFPIGVLILGARLERLMPEMDSAGGYTVVVTGERVLSSTVPGVEPGAAWDTAATARGALALDGDVLVLASHPLGRTETGVPATLVMARSLGASLGPVNRSLGRNFLLAGVVAVLLVGAGGAFLAHSTLRPLSQFVWFLRDKVGGGGFGHFQAPPGSPAEIATLSEAYNGLIDSLRGQHQQLEERTMQLAAANESLHEEVRERARAEAALKDSEEQLRQSQKLEALGTLAGGVAHDFNNLLSVIIGYAQIAVQDLPPDSPLHGDIGQINRAADRASGLVRQLLAFSRKQVLQPQIVDLNAIVFGMEKMLRRLIGEDVNLSTHLAPRLARIKADPGQVEQVLLNLIVNARDAMPTGGSVTISTENVELDDRYEHRPGAIAGGPAVMLSVQDTGTGMDQGTMDRIFEPFFTTKPPGKGTGLGLSTVYGIVKQSGGSITVYSQPGEGTTFRIYFPPAVAGAEAERGAGPTNVPPGSETILIAEDEGQLRALLRRSLGALGYTVLEAADGREALEVARRHAGPIHLLLTDVVMPNLSGKELAGQLAHERPGLRVVFISGYSDEAIERHGVLAPGTVFVQKPVSLASLARTVREVLDGDRVRTPV
jgi:signal transduction histidine kinase/CheY-like chemotaxis protein